MANSNKTNIFQKTITFNIVNPIAKATRDGIFKMTETSLEKYKSNLYTLVFTGKGTRIMDPEFGTSIYNLLFDPIDEEMFQSITDEINKQAEKYIPDIKIIDIIFDDSANTIDNNTINMVIKFQLRNDPTTQDFIEVVMGT